MECKKKLFGTIRGLIILILPVLWGYLCFTTQAAKFNSKILFISSYSYEYLHVQKQIAGITRVFRDENVSLDYEFMNVKQVDDEDSARLFHDWLAYRLSVQEPYDAIILGDDPALQFAMEYQEELFAGVPMIFMGVNDDSLAKEAVENPFITGIQEEFSLDKNIELGKKLIPGLKRVVAIVDDSYTSEVEKRRFMECAAKYPDLDLETLNTAEYSPQILRYLLGRFGDDTVVIFISMFRDLDGNRYSVEQAVSFITESVKVPVLRVLDSGIGEGVLGGSIVSMEETGVMAANLTKEILLRHKAIEAVGLELSPIVNMIDANVMRDFRLDFSKLPEDTVFVDSRKDFYSENKHLLIPGFIMIGILLIIIIVVICMNRRNKKLVRELEEARKIMERASQHDFLTGIPNRNKFVSDLSSLIEQNIPCTVFMIDIDDFKKINDTMGHTAGDEALIHVASRLKEMESQILTPYRFAGDEFILILQSSQFKIMEKTAFQCRQVFSKTTNLSGHKTKICGSIGIASYPKDASSLEELIAHADSAMYRVKKNGKNDFAFYESETAE